MTTGVPAHEWLAVVERNELIRVLRAYGETTDAAAARRIADAICVSRTHGALPRRTKDFAALVARAKGVEYQLMHPAKLTFQVSCICVFPVVVVSACNLRFLERCHVAKGVISMAPTGLSEPPRVTGVTHPRVTFPRVTGVTHPRATFPRVTFPRVTGVTDPRVTFPRVTGVTHPPE